MAQLPLAAGKTDCYAVFLLFRRCQMGFIIKITIVGAAGYIVYKMIKSKIKTGIVGPHVAKKIKADADLVLCEQCGSFADATAIILQSGKRFCSQECRQAYEKQGE